MTDHALTPHANRPPLRPGSLTDLVELVPYLLGFHPRDSLVLVALRGPHRRVGVTMRVDLPEARRCAGLPAVLAGHVRRDGATEALALVYAGVGVDGDPPAGLPDPPLVRAVASGLADAGLTLVDALYVGAGRWWSYACDRTGCCPPEGRALPAADGRTSPAVATATYAGLVALPDRRALEQTLERSNPVSDQAVARAEADLATATGAAGAGGTGSGADRDGRQRWRRQVLGEIAGAVDEHIAAARAGLPEEWVARFLVALRDEEVRDECCDWVEGDRGERALALWRHLAARATSPYDVTPLALVAWSAWHTGAGPLARIAVDRVLARDPGCRLAILLDQALERGINPATVRGRPRGRRRQTRRHPPPGWNRPGP
ncbi:MAG TPA: DUF4192 domain-containing protein [Mycobacteriales bacterium]|nr:DUF4192 domain-containing protein [Mycobacteriales bacterium]